MYITNEDFKKVNYLTIGFENCEVMTVSLDDLLYLHIGNISTTLNHMNETFNMDENRKAYRSVLSKTNDVYMKFKRDVKTLQVFLEKDKGIVKRINEWNDITSLDLTETIQDYYEDGIYVKWKGEDIEKNDNQLVGYDSNGCFHVYIGEDEEMVKMFSNNVGIGDEE